MSDTLKELCNSLNIELVYTNNKVMVLTYSTENNHPIIRVHKIFKECNEDIANAIISYYLKTENREKNLKVIENYLNNAFNSKRYKIKPPGNDLNCLVLMDVKPNGFSEEAKSDLIEMKISSITKKSFYESNFTVNPDDSLKLSEDDILEVNIVVDPFNT